MKSECKTPHLLNTYLNKLEGELETSTKLWVSAVQVECVDTSSQCHVDVVKAANADFLNNFLVDHNWSKLFEILI